MRRARCLLWLYVAVGIGAVALLRYAPAMAQAATWSATPAAGAFRPGEVIVKYRAAARTAERFSARGLVGARPLRSFEFIRAELVQVDGSVPEAVARLRADPAVEYAEPNYELHLLTVPNDPLFPQMYALRNTGQTGGTPGADIRAVQAWDIFTGDTAIKIGVIDTGVDYTHPDLAANIWTNPGEIPGNGVDDDGNGYVDDIHGYDFANNDGDPFDDHGHGTHVSGTIAAVGNNNLGVVGINWRARIVGIKFLNAGGSGSTAGAIAAVQYALAAGVRLTSNSWGGGEFSQSLLDAINAAGAAGQVFVAAAGNSSINIDITPTYPVAYDSPYILGVAATDHNDVLASFSNWGPNHVQLAAPGVAILSTLPGATYGLFSGTSMATPHVSGALGFMLGRFPGMSAMLARNLLLQGVDPVPGLNGRVATGGRLNLLTPVLEPDSIPPAPITDLAVVDRSSNGLVLAWTATGDDGLTGRAVRYDIRYSTAPITAANFPAASPAAGPSPRPSGSPDSAEVLGLAFNTSYYIAIKALDEFGNPGGISNLATGTTLGIPDLTATPASFSQELLTGATASQTLTLRNDGAGTLDWAAPLPELVFAQQAPYEFLSLAKGEADPRAGFPVIEGAGGPDGFGYRWIDSDQPGGPPFAWADIAALGTPVPIVGDDATSPPIPMGMAFPFYGSTFSSVRVSTNGFVSFTDASASYSNQPLPNLGAPANMIAALWDDLYVPASNQVLTYYDGSRFIISWLGVPHLGSGGPYTFQILLYPSGEMRLQYQSLRPPTNSATVGIQNGSRTIGLTTAFDNGYLHDGLALRYSRGPDWLSISPRSGRLTAGQSAALDVRFNGVELLGGDYNAQLRIDSNDPDENPTLLPVTMRVIGAPDMSVEGVERIISSTQPFSGDGASTSHTLSVPEPPVSGGSLELVAEGDYADPSETATLTAEGRNLGQAGGVGVDCETATALFPVTQPVLADLVADGVVHALVQNSLEVGSFCVLNRHTVRLRYRLGADALSFGEVFIGTCLAETLVVRNRGTDSLRVTGVDVTGVGFTVPTAGFVLGVGEARNLAVRFCPTGVGDYTGTLTIHGNDPDRPSHTAVLTGRGVVPPDIGVTPSSLAADLLSGESVTQTIHIANTGGSDLFLDATQNTGGVANPDPGPRPASWVRVSGDDPASRQAPAGYSAPSPTPHATTGSQVLVIMDGLPWGSPADQVLLDANGIAYDLIPSSELAATDLTRYRVVMVPSDQPTSTYATLAAQAGRIESYVAGGGTLEFHGAGWGWSSGDASLVPLPGGARINFRLSDVNRVLIPAHPLMAGVPDPFTGTSASHAYLSSLPAGALVISTEENALPTLVEYRHGLGVVLASTQTLEFGFQAGQAPGTILRNLIPYAFNYAPPWLSVDPTHATVPPGTTLDLLVHIDSGTLLGGTYRGDVKIDSNDPDESLVTVPVELRVTGVPNIDVTPTSFAFGSLFIGLTLRDTVVVANLGTDSLRIAGVAVDDADYTVSGGGFVLAPGARRRLEVAFHPSRPGPIEATLRVTSDDPDHGVFAVALHGIGLVAPIVSAQPDSLSADLLSGQTATRTLTVSNTGGSPLTVEMKSVGRNMNAAQRQPRRYQRAADPHEVSPWVPSEPTPNLTRPSSGPVAMAGDYIGTYLHFGISDFGEIMPFQYPNGNEHLAVGSYLSGYTVAYESQGSDNLAFAGFESRYNIAPVSYRVITDNAALLVAEAVTRTQDSRLLITRTFSFTKSDKGVRIETQLKDMTGSGLARVVFKEWADWDVDSRFDDTWDYDRSRNMVYAQATHFAGIAGQDPPSAMDIVGWNDFSNRQTLVDVPNGPVLVDGLGLLHYELGDLGPSETQEVVAAFGIGDNLDELRQVIDRTAMTGGWLAMDPESFEVPAGGSTDVRVTFDPGQLLGGNYDAFAQIASNDPVTPVLQVPAHLHVTGVADITVEGALIVLESVQDYSSDGAVTLHSLPVTVPPSASGSVELLAEGDYGDATEQAALVVEGRALGSVGGVGSDCAPADGTFEVDATTLAALVADGVIDARVQNTPPVNFFCPINRHTVRVSYRQRPDSLLFGSLFIGESRTLEIRVRNTGTDDLMLNSANVSGAGFSVIGASFPATLRPGEHMTLQVRFAPAAACALCPGTLTISSNDPDEASVLVALEGSAVQPPDIDVTPTVIVSNLLVPARETRTVTIANPGLSDLVFTVTPAAADSGAVAAPAGPHGPDVRTSSGDPKRDGAALAERFQGPLVPLVRREHVQGGTVLVIADGGTEGDVRTVLNAAGFQVTQVTDDADWNGSNPSPEGFQAVILLDGPDYGDNMPTAGQAALMNYVQHGGGLILTEWIAYEVESGYYQSMRPLIPLTRSSGYSGTFFYNVVQNHPVTTGVSPTFPVTSGLSTGTANSGTTLVAGGDGSPMTIAKELGLGRIVEFSISGNYGGYRPFTMPDMQRLLVNAADWVSRQGWLSVSPAGGVVPAGSHLDLSVLINSDGLQPGVYRDSIRIHSNDPDEHLVGVPVTLNASVVPDIDPLPATVDFGALFVGQGRTLSLQLRNRGLAELEVTSGTVTGNGYSMIGATFPIHVPPTGVRAVSVRFEPPEVCAPCSGSIRFVSNDPDENPLDVALTGSALLPPDIALSPLEVRDTVTIPNVHARPLLVQNAGASPLYLSFESIAVGPAMLAPTWLSVTPESDTIAAGASKSFPVTFTTAGLLGATYRATLRVHSNDPDESSLDVPVTLVAVGVPDIAVNQSPLLFGTVFTGYSRDVVLNLKNNGTDTLRVASGTPGSAVYQLVGATFPVRIAPLGDADLTVRFAPTVACDPCSTALVLRSNDPDEDPLAVPLVGAGLVPPDAAFQPALVLASAATTLGPEPMVRTRIVRLDNTGGSPLEFSSFAISAADTVAIYEPLERTKDPGGAGPEPPDPRPGILGNGGPDQFGYRWRDSDSPGGPPFQWVDITHTGIRLPMIGDDLFQPNINIGFFFRYYGSQFRFINVCTNGFISFTSTSSTPFNEPLPSRLAPHTMLAPFWDDLDFGAVQRAWVKSEGSRFIVTWDAVPRHGGTGPYTFQVILYASGRIVYQYLHMGPPTNSATVGFQNNLQNDGLTMAFNHAYVHDSLAVEIYNLPRWLSVSPSSGSIPAGGSADVEVRVNADLLPDGNYTGSVSLHTNDPDETTLNVPVNLHVGVVSAGLDLDPNVLNRNSTANWASAGIELPAGFDPHSLEPGTLRAQRSLPIAEGAPYDFRDSDGDGVLELWCKFDREQFMGLLPDGAAVPVETIGEIPGVTWFQALDVVRLMRPGMQDPPLPNRIYQAGTNVLLEWLPTADTGVHYDLWYSGNDGASWSVSATGLTGQSCVWTVPALTTDVGRLELVAIDAQGVRGSWLSGKLHIQAGVSMVDGQLPTQLGFRQLGENPARGVARVELALPERANVELRVFDVHGASVRRLVSRTIDPGWHPLEWDGRDDGGRQVGAGVYFLRMVAAGKALNLRVAMVR